MHVISAFPKTVLWIVTFVGSIGLAPTTGNAQTARIEVHPFQTMTLTDDYVPVAPCRSYVERLRQGGKDVQLTEYPDAHHGFDNPRLKAPVSLPQAQTGRRCTWAEKPVGQLINPQTAQPFSLDAPCIERGATVAYNAQAHSEALKAVKDFLTIAFNRR